MFNLFKDESHVKVTRENWNKIEGLFEQKEQKIREQEKLINELMKYKENDDLLFAYENQVKSDAKKIKYLNAQVQDLEKALIYADRKVSAVLSLESVYLQKIIKTKSELRRSEILCPDYETRGEALIETYA